MLRRLELHIPPLHHPVPANMYHADLLEPGLERREFKPTSLYSRDATKPVSAPRSQDPWPRQAAAGRNVTQTSCGRSLLNGRFVCRRNNSTKWKVKTK